MTTYQLGKSRSGTYQQLATTDSSAYVKGLKMYGFADCISFSKKNRDGSTVTSDWNLNGLSCFSELKNYERLQDMPRDALHKLSVRMSSLLFHRKSKAPKILEELVELQDAQKKGVAANKIEFPEISSTELAASDLW